MHLRNLQKKKFAEVEHSLSQQHQLVHGYGWAPGTLTMQGKPVLQGARPPEDNSRFFADTLLLYIYTYTYTYMCVCVYIYIYIYIYTSTKYVLIMTSVLGMWQMHFFG